MNVTIEILNYLCYAINVIAKYTYLNLSYYEILYFTAIIENIIVYNRS